MHLVLEKGWFVTNLIGEVVLLAIFVLLHIVVAIKAFGLISLIPHHVPKMLGFSPANRVDMDEFSKAAAWTGTRGTLRTIDHYARSRLSDSAGQNVANDVGSSSIPALSAPRKGITGPANSSTKSGGVDSTLSAQTDVGDHNKEA
ncbi:hypothetical protein [Methylosinus sp. PW1]|uniref:hypothetical protein n=1 Tax=Methylosinus sp. PW1 TaxID=107636 RepID=UPI00068EC537|nr:hypothetical protein [Methylosinus sp. PW1]